MAWPPLSLLILSSICLEGGGKPAIMSFPAIQRGGERERPTYIAHRARGVVLLSPNLFSFARRELFPSRSPYAGSGGLTLLNWMMCPPVSFQLVADDLFWQRWHYGQLTLSLSLPLSLPPYLLSLPLPALAATRRLTTFGPEALADAHTTFTTGYRYML